MLPYAPRLKGLDRVTMSCFCVTSMTTQGLFQTCPTSKATSETLCQELLSSYFLTWPILGCMFPSSLVCREQCEVHGPALTTVPQSTFQVPGEGSEIALESLVAMSTDCCNPGCGLAGFYLLPALSVPAGSSLPLQTDFTVLGHAVPTSCSCQGGGSP